MTAVPTLDASRRAARWPSHKGSLFVCDDASVTGDDLDANVHSAALGFRDMGVEHGDRVALLLRNGSAFVETFFAAIALGAVPVLVDPRWKSDDVAHILSRTSPKVVVAEEGVAKRHLASFLDGSAPVVVAGNGDGAHVLPYAALRTCAGDLAPPMVQGDDVAAIIYTSGTGGCPKGVTHTHESLLGCVNGLSEMYKTFFAGGLREGVQRTRRLLRYRRRIVRAMFGGRTWMTPLGFNSIAGLTIMLQALLSGQRLVTVTTPHPRRLLELADRENVTVLAITPTIGELMLRLPDFDSFDLSGLLVLGLGGSLVPGELARRLRDRIGCALAIGYGSTELGGGVLATNLADSDDAQTETVGRPFPGVELRIVDQNRRELPPGEIGELAVMAPGRMEGYWQEADETAIATDTAGWYYTGDLAVSDSDGYVRIVGRKRDLIIRGGQNIFPDEIEQVLREHPAVDRAAVVGVPDKLAGERIWAFLVTPPGLAIDAKNVAELCRARLPSYKWPDHYCVQPELPTTPEGKVQRYILRQLALREREAHSA